MTAPASPLGFGLLAIYSTAVLPVPDPDGGPPVMVAVTTVQPTLGLATDPRTGKRLPDVASGRLLLAGAIECRLSTPIGTLPDVVVPTTLGNYGIDLLDTGYADLTVHEAGMLGADVDAQVRMDERVVTTTTNASAANDLLIVAIKVTDGAGPFALTLAIDTLNANLSVLSSPT